MKIEITNGNIVSYFEYVHKELLAGYNTSGICAILRSAIAINLKSRDKSVTYNHYDDLMQNIMSSGLVRSIAAEHDAAFEDLYWWYRLESTTEHRVPFVEHVLDYYKNHKPSHEVVYTITERGVFVKGQFGFKDYS